MSPVIKVIGISFAALYGLGLLVGDPKVDAPAPESDARDARYQAQWTAIRACMNAVRYSETSLYPNKADFYVDVKAFSDDGINWSVVGTVDLINDYGTMLPHRYACVVHGSEVVSGTLS